MSASENDRIARFFAGDGGAHITVQEALDMGFDIRELMYGHRHRFVLADDPYAPSRPMTPEFERFVYGTAWLKDKEPS